MWNYNYTPSPDELFHHGIKGQKWGVRRYQNKDGSLTPAGKKREAKLTKKAEKKYAKAGAYAGEAQYYKDKGREILNKKNKTASIIDKEAEVHSKQGNYARSAAGRMMANNVRKEGNRQKSEYDQTSKRISKLSEKKMKKASDFATKNNVKIGKDKVDEIIKKNKQKGYKDAKEWDEVLSEQELRDKYGDAGYEFLRELGDID